MKKQQLSRHNFEQGFIASFPALDERVANSMQAGSRGHIPSGAHFRPWKGLAIKGGAGSGGRRMVQLGDTYGSIRDNGGTQGTGSLFSDIGRSVWGIGAGIPRREITDIAVGFTLSTSLKVSIAVAGVYSAATTYTAGLGQPSAPDVAVVAAPGAGFTGDINGPISIKIARFRSTTGGRSIASTTSAVISPINNTVRVTFPLAASGQDYWRVFFTQQGFGGVGLHYALPRNGSIDIPESVVAAGVVDGVARSLEFDYKDGDLVPDLAYIDDYPPPAGTHACRLENVMCVLGAYGDSSSSVSSTATGTVGAISLPNFYESYKPSHLIFFPEQVVDVMARPTDSYGYVGHRNSITALQYVGLRDGPAVAVQVIVPDAGIAKPHNWCQVQGLLYMRISKGGFVRMRGDGSLDYDWAKPIWDAVKDWDDTTIVGWHPNKMCVVIANGTEAYAFSLLTERWGSALWLTDAGVTGSYLSCVNSQGELVVTVNNAGTHTAYGFDSGAATMPVTQITEWRGGYRPATLMELGIAFETDSAANPIIVGLHRNLRKTYVRDAQTVNASPTITSVSAGWDASMVGMCVCVFGANVGGAGINQLIGRISAIAGNDVTIVNPDTGAALVAGASLVGAYMLIGHSFKALTLTRIGAQHTGPIGSILMSEALSYTISVNMVTNATQGQVLEIDCLGTVSESPVSLVA